jgi:hypothetical protein
MRDVGRSDQVLRPRSRPVRPACKRPTSHETTAASGPCFETPPGSNPRDDLMHAVRQHRGAPAARPKRRSKVPHIHTEVAS